METKQWIFYWHKILPIAL